MTDVKITDLPAAASVPDTSAIPVVVNGVTSKATPAQVAAGAGVTPVSRGGTSATTPNDAMNALLPAQGLVAGKFLQTDGTNATWQPMALAAEIDTTTDNDYIVMSTSDPDSPVTKAVLTGILYNPGAQKLTLGSDDPSHPDGFKVGAGYQSQNVYVGAGNPGSDGNPATGNVAVGYNAFTAVTLGSNNTVVGATAGALLTTGQNNTLVGSGAGSEMLPTSSNNTIVGKYTPPSLEINDFVALADGLGNLSYSDDGLRATVWSNRLGIAVPFTFPATLGLPNQILTTDGNGDTSWVDAPEGGGVKTFSGGTTGLLPNTPEAGDVVLDGVLLPANGGTGLAAYSPGALLYSPDGNVLAELTAGADGYVLTIQGGMPEWTPAGGGGLIGVTQSSTPFKTALGSGAMDSTTGGTYNTGVGYNAGTALLNGSYNTVFGAQAMQAATGTNNNTAIGGLAMAAATTGSSNTAVGYSALRNVGIGGNNVAVGVSAGINATGGSNTFVGSLAGGTVTTIANSVFVGYDSGGVSTSSANGAVGVGHSALGTLTTGAANIAVGYQSGSKVTTGQHNTFMGYQAGTDVVSGNDNVIIGYLAGQNETSNNNVYIGSLAATTSTGGYGNVCIGWLSGTNITAVGGNTFIGTNSGSGVISGNNNTIIGGAFGTNTMSAEVWLCDGFGNPSLKDDGSNLTLYANRKTTAIPFRIPIAQGTAGQVLTNDGTGKTYWSTGGGSGSGTVTSVEVDGGTTGLTTSGGPITTAGTISIGGVLSIAHGGSGAVTVEGALNNFLPSQDGHAGKALVTDGVTPSWVTIEGSGTVNTAEEWRLGFYAEAGNAISGTPDAAYYAGLEGQRYIIMGDTADVSQIGGVVMAGSGNQITLEAPPGLTVDYTLRLPKTAGTALQVMANDGEGQLIWVNQGSGGGTVTSVNVSGGTTGMIFSNGPITHSGTIAMSGTLNIANGGTGATSQSSALNNLLPSQSGNANKVLTTDGTNAAWVTASSSAATSVTIPATGGNLGGPAVVNTSGAIEQVTGFNPLVQNHTPAGVNPDMKNGVSLPIYDTDGLTVAKVAYLLMNSDNSLQFFVADGTDNSTLNVSAGPFAFGTNTKTGLGLVKVSDSMYVAYGAGLDAGNLGAYRITQSGNTWTVTTAASSSIAVNGNEMATTVYDPLTKHIVYYWGADGLFCTTYNPTANTWTPAARVTTGTASGPITAVRFTNPQNAGAADYLLIPTSEPNNLIAAYINVNSQVSSTIRFTGCLPAAGWAMEYSDEADCLVVILPWTKDEGNPTTPHCNAIIGLRPRGNKMFEIIPVTPLTDEAPTANVAYRCAPLMKRNKSGQFYYAWINSSLVPRLTAFYINVDGGGQPQLYIQGQTQPFWGIQTTFMNGAFPALVTPTGKKSLFFLGNPTSSTSMYRPYLATYVAPNLNINNLVGVYLDNTKVQVSGILTKPAWGLTPGLVYGARGIDTTPFYEWVPLSKASVRAGKSISATQLVIG